MQLQGDHFSTGNADRIVIIDRNPAVPGIGIEDKAVVASKLQALKIIHAVHEFDVRAVPYILTVADQRTEILHQLPVVIVIELITVAPDIHEVQVLLFKQRIKGFTVLEKAVLMVAVACQRYGFSGRAKLSEEPTTRE